MAKKGGNKKERENNNRSLHKEGLGKGGMSPKEIKKRKKEEKKKKSQN